MYLPINTHIQHTQTHIDPQSYTRHKHIRTHTLIHMQTHTHTHTHTPTSTHTLTFSDV